MAPQDGAHIPTSKAVTSRSEGLFIPKALNANKSSQSPKDHDKILLFADDMLIYRSNLV